MCPFCEIKPGLYLSVGKFAQTRTCIDQNISLLDFSVATTALLSLVNDTVYIYFLNLNSSLQQLFQYLKYLFMYKYNKKLLTH